jgi:hypothetical protein
MEVRDSKLQEGRPRFISAREYMDGDNLLGLMLSNLLMDRIV